jgi:hypothetical protein
MVIRQACIELVLPVIHWSTQSGGSLGRSPGEIAGIPWQRVIGSAGILYAHGLGTVIAESLDVSPKSGKRLIAGTKIAPHAARRHLV